jgi:uncharacterized protein (DUF1778 family)
MSKAKDGWLNLRILKAKKKRLARAAKKSNKTLTAFVLESAEEKAAAVLTPAKPEPEAKAA